ncbi:U-box domain-containing protein 63 [Eutrema salsugineum]|uniref:U-box domain-containing protein 63 n=1 Tax=Eutrema salsugineum TaxID=72664 RepID=UPI000CED5CE9|nr:U-box domain-containing protein 63 [Eutrema salsugineum]
MQNDEGGVFGGKVVVFGGDFSQILPVMHGASRGDVANAALNASYIWDYCKVIKLTKNMRLLASKIAEPNDGEAMIDIPEEFLVTDVHDPIEAIYDDEDNVCVRRRGSLIYSGIDSSNNCTSVAEETNREIKNPAGWELVVRHDEEEKSSIYRHEMELKVMITSPDGNVSNSSHRKTQSKRDFAYLEKEKITSVSSWESLKAILSDPVTGALMNDATILPCGHSFGAGGLKQVKRMVCCQDSG